MMKDSKISEAIICSVDETREARIRFLGVPIRENEDEINVFVPLYQTVIGIELVEISRGEKDEIQ